MGNKSPKSKDAGGLQKQQTLTRQKIQVNVGRKQQGVHELKQNYIIDNKTKVLGVGAFGRVFMTTNKFEKNFQVAIKVLDKHKLRDNIDCIMEEVAILNRLDHPNIVKYFETYDDSKYMYLVMEYINGQQLFDKITQQENQTFGEGEAAGYMQKLFQAINHCHAQGVIHRDIKPENIMITESGSVRLIDFGLSKASKTNKNLTTVAGTPYYMAPEVLDGSYGSQADIWSLGVLLYTLVSGYLPFQGATSAEVFRKIKEADFHFNHGEFDSISDECKDLIRKLLVVDAKKKRLTGQQALSHPWFKKQHTSDQKIGVKVSEDVINRLRSFRGVSKFKRAAMNILVKMATEEEVKELRAQFQAIDTDGTGLILASELASLVQKKELSLSKSDINEMIKEVDFHGNGKINYSEFLAATIDVRSFLTDQKMQAIFQQFDTDNSGKITQENIYLAMQKMGQEIKREEIIDMISKHDIRGDGVLSFDEFKQVFFDGTALDAEDMDAPFGKEGPEVSTKMV